ncbi:MAG: TlpA family protein disulfide reductase [Acidobacteriaceae bacterium]|nr:TlpA family protein disulfide reductase [Acidobacteriaceae bacterium]
MFIKRVFTAALMACVGQLCSAADATTPRKAPELAFHLPGQGEKLLSQLRARVVALEFILTTCPHCQVASRTMSNYQQQYGSRGFQALDLAINGLDEGRTPTQADELVAQFARQFQAAFPVGWIARDPMLEFMGFSVAERFVVPQLVLIDRKGFIRYQTPPLGDAAYENAMKEETVRQRIEELLSETAATTVPRHSPGTAGTASARQ